MIRPDQFPPPVETFSQTLPLTPLARALAERVRAEGGRALLVGGFVRDLYLGQTHGDLDLEVFGLDPETLEGVAKEVASARSVGRDFGILKVGPLDVSLPRLDREPGRSGFLLGDPSMSFQDASKRRDFTLNALACDPLTGEIFDAWGGLADLRARRLTPVSRETFVEDPLRALRAVQFVARFALEPSPLTLELMAELSPLLLNLPRERVFEEWCKLLSKGEHFARALEMAHQTGLIHTLLPELEPLSVWQPTVLAIECAALYRQGKSQPSRETPGREEADRALMWATFLHRLAGPLKTEPGPLPLQDPTPVVHVFDRLSAERRLHSALESLASTQAIPLWLHTHTSPGAAFDALVRRLSVLVRIDVLIPLARAIAGIPPTAPYPPCDRLLERASALEVVDRAPPPLVQGRDLLARKLPPGPQMGALLKAAYDAQLEGTFSTPDGALRWLDSRLSEKEGDTGPQS